MHKLKTLGELKIPYENFFLFFFLLDENPVEDINWLAPQFVRISIRWAVDWGIQEPMQNKQH